MRTIIGAKAAVVAAAMVAGLVIAGSLVLGASQAAFTDSTDNGVNNWATGTVVLSDDDSNVAMFNALALQPGSTGERCIRVLYTGTLASTVKLYSASVSGALGPYLDMVIEEGDLGAYASCGGFVAIVPAAYNGTLTNLGTTATNFGTGVGTFAPTASGQSKVYRITYTVNATTPDAAQGTVAAATFVWEAQNSS
jgi:hypothetical protein